jgi:hypothetical protein
LPDARVALRRERRRPRGWPRFVWRQKNFLESIL